MTAFAIRCRSPGPSTPSRAAWTAAARTSARPASDGSAELSSSAIPFCGQRLAAEDFVAVGRGHEPAREFFAAGTLGRTCEALDNRRKLQHGEGMRIHAGQCTEARFCVRPRAPYEIYKGEAPVLSIQDANPRTIASDSASKRSRTTRGDPKSEALRGLPLVTLASLVVAVVVGGNGRRTRRERRPGQSV